MSLRLGIFADSQAQAYALQTVAPECGITVAFNGRIAPRHSQWGDKPEVDAWVIAGGKDGMSRLGKHPFINLQQHQVLILEHPVPTLASIEFEQWKSAMVEQLQLLSARHRKSSDCQPAEIIWVLAASTGGLDAVGRFLTQVPPVAGVGLVYVQHITDAHVGQLLKMVSRLSDWKVEVGLDGTRFRERTVTVISPAAKVHMDVGGRLRILGYPWGGQYCPSIDHVAGLVAREYGAMASMIVFTGMGYDAVVGSRLIRHRGGEVWVQDPADCAARSMPETVISVQAVDFVGSVNQLAVHFNEKYEPSTPALAAGA